jgi:hypothetical protein
MPCANTEADEDKVSTSSRDANSVDSSSAYERALTIGIVVLFINILRYRVPGYVNHSVVHSRQQLSFFSPRLMRTRTFIYHNLALQVP